MVKSPQSPLRLCDVVDAQGCLSWQESIALVQSVAGASVSGGPAVPTEASGTIADDFVLHADGTVTPAGEARRAVSVSELALFLGQLLPSAQRDGERAPAGVKFTIARALGLVEAPPIPSVRQFTATLERFERQDRATVLAALYERHWSTWRPARTDRREHGPSADVFRRLLRDADEREWNTLHATSDERIDDRVSATRADVLRRFLREADERNYTLAAALRERTAVARSRPAAGGAAARRRQLQTGLGVVALVAAAAVAERHPFGRTSQAPASAARSGVRSSPMAVAAPAPSPQAAARPATPWPRSAVATKVSAVGARRLATAGPRELPGRMVEALDVNLRPVFSPSFSSDGSAVFFDIHKDGGSAVMSAEPRAAGTTGSASDLRVVSLVDDGARNYHPRLSPDSRTLAFDSDRDGERGVYLADRDGRHVRRVSGAGYAAVPTWSPDGRQLAFVKAEQDHPKVWNVWILDVAQGATRRVTDYRYGQPWGASWFPDGRRICYAHEDSLVVLDLASGRSVTYASPKPGRLVRTPAVSPNGRFVVFQLYRDGAWLLDLLDAGMRRILSDPSAEEFAWTPDGRRVAFHSRRSGEWGVWFMAPEP